MAFTGKLLWGEGLFLRPQHFQQQDKHHSDYAHELAKIAQPYSWGVDSFKCDEDALANNLLRILNLSLVFQDGEMVKAPVFDDLPDAIDLNQLPVSLSSITYYVGIANLKPHGDNFASHPNSHTRYSLKNMDTSDAYTKSIDAEVSYLKNNILLISEHEPRDSYTSMPLLRIRRLSTGGFELDTTFIPPCLSIKSAPYLFELLRKLLDALQAKVNALYGYHREPSQHVIEHRTGDVSSFWLLHTASAAFASLSHYYHHPQMHPERLYEQLLHLSGALLAYSKHLSLSDLPQYDHRNPGPSFVKLHTMIRDLLDTVISSKFFSILLHEVKPSYLIGNLASDKINDSTNFYLAVSADVPTAELIDVVPVRFKVGAPDDVDKLVLSAMPGVRIMHAPQVPAAIPLRPDTHYFLLENKGPLFERMIQAQSISVYTPAGIKNIQVELMAVI